MMRENTDFFKAFVILSIGVLVNAFLYFMSHVIHVDSETARVVESLMVLVSTFLVKRAIDVIVFMPLERRGKFFFPRWFKHLLALLLAFVAATLIVVHIYNQPFLSVATFSGLMGAGFAISVQGIVIDFFAGLTQDVERHFDEGDWLKLEGETLQVKKIGWRSTTLVSHFNTTITLPNSKLNERIENLSRPGPYTYQYVEVIVDHDIPIGRVKRLLEDAILSMKENRPEKVYVIATKATEGGVSYAVAYSVVNIELMILLKSEVLTAVVDHLHRYGLGVSEALGTYALMRAEKSLVEKRLPDPELVLAQSPLFKNLTVEQRQALLKGLSVEVFTAGTTLLQSDQDVDLFYLIAEGTVGMEARLKLSKTSAKRENAEPLQQTASSPIRYFGLGELVGSFYFLHQNEALLSLRTETSLVCYAIPKAVLMTLFKKTPSLLKQLEQMIHEDHKMIQKSLAQSISIDKARASVKNRLEEIFKEIISI
ncbi:MAG: mechanosensitive ion channel [Alphaproteobacteria bacterium]|nr:mechanosensitive ion channel [Alphaproteobacteria bacterium]